MAKLATRPIGTCVRCQRFDSYRRVNGLVLCAACGRRAKAEAASTDCADCGERRATVHLPEGRDLCRPCWTSLRALRQAVLKGSPTAAGESLREARAAGHERGQKYVDTGVCDHCEGASTMTTKTPTAADFDASTTHGIAENRAEAEALQLHRCIGSATFGIEAHDAPASDFPAQASRKGGLGRMCSTHWTLYTRALREARLAKKAAAEFASAPTAAAAVEASITKAKAARAQRRAAPRRAKASASPHAREAAPPAS